MKVAVIGGGPSGMMAAYVAANNGAEVTLFEHNEKLGKKMYISGKGRCNVTNDCTPREFVDNIATNSKFALNCLYKFPPSDFMEWCNSNGLQLKVERGNRVFPVSDKSSDVISFFARMLRKVWVNVTLNTQVDSIECCKNDFLLTTISDIETKKQQFDKVIVATGGKSYSATGSTGDGYRFAKSTGHQVHEPKPALCRMMCKQTKSLEGLSLKNVSVSLLDKNGKVVCSQFGEMLFTADGVSGPCVLTLSSLANKIDLSGASLSIDLKPALSVEKLDERVLRDFAERINKDFCHALDALLPQRLCDFVVARTGIAPNKKVNQISAKERAKLVATLKSLTFPVVGLGSVEHCIVTCGGVDVKQINPSTMESKICKGLYFVGEVVDVDAFTGGFNIQFALSTGYAAGEHAAKEW